MSNLEELKYTHQRALVLQMIELSRRCSVIWNSLSPSQFKAKNLPYEFVLTKTGSNMIVFEINKNGRPYRTINSDVSEDVNTLFVVVSNLSEEKNKKLNQLSSLANYLGGCRSRVFNIVMNGGVVANGNSPVVKTSPLTVNLTPISLNFGPTSFPWVGTVGDISEDVLTNDGDFSYIRQQIAGALPTNWGYAIIDFNTSSITGNMPFSFSARVAHRRESEDGVNLVAEIIVNSGVIYSNTIVSNETYSLFQSGFIVATGETSISSLQLRLSMYTNSGNINPRAIRITAADIVAVSRVVN